MITSFGSKETDNYGIGVELKTYHGGGATALQDFFVDEF